MDDFCVYCSLCDGVVVCYRIGLCSFNSCKVHVQTVSF